MLEDLHVRDIALLTESWIEFTPGLTVLTGETGAGKTALLSALKLLVGERADSIVVREGAGEALVEGRFFSDDGEVLVKRRLTADGRSKCSIDDEMVTVGTLASRIGPLVDLHGQHDHQRLLSPASHVGYLDRWTGERALKSLATYQQARTAYHQALETLAQVQGSAVRAAEEAEMHRIAAAEIDAIDPQPGEYEELGARLPRLEHAQQLREGVEAATAALYDEGGATERIASARDTLQRVASVDAELDGLEERLASVQIELEDVSAELRSYLEQVDADPQQLERMLDRVGQIEGLIKRFGPRIEDVFERREVAHRMLELTTDSEAAIERAQQQVAYTKEVLETAAGDLAKVRSEFAPAFADATSEAVADLGMSGAVFSVASTDLPFAQWTASGSQRIEFLYAPSGSLTPRPLSKIASGGEISRVMLALKGILAHVDDAQTLVFDEIDAGVGGAAANAVGARLKELSRTSQVIVVTHLPQVAAYADAHIYIEKQVHGERTVTKVATLTEEERIDEIARMLSGDHDEVAREHARALIEKSAARPSNIS